MRRLQALDEQEWARLWSHYAPRLYAYIAQRVFDEDAREDVRQETMLGALRGIHGFDPTFSFEQYLFGICHNRTIDHLRRARHRTSGGAISGTGGGDAPIEAAEPVDPATPEELAAEEELARRARALFVQLLAEWVREAREQGEWRRLMVIEALFGAGWRNKDTWRRLGLSDEKTVAGIKFRVLRRLREMVAADPAWEQLAETLRSASAEDPHAIGFDVARAWREARVSCPGPAALQALADDRLPEGEAQAVRLHLQELGCEACRRDLAAREGTRSRVLPSSGIREKVRRHLPTRSQSPAHSGPAILHARAG
ncbi:MAG TPA: sigma-70 family RNA polymerase sigma factor [Planctomycetota bacterium]|nr:sigma-70 family RNA polymerase sigma factor [Planctomycetota bacterium]